MNVVTDEKIRAALDYLLRCLDEDLRSGQPSRDPSFLNAVMDGLYQVEFVGNAQRQVRVLLEKFRTTYGAEISLDPDAVMRAILEASQAEMVSEDEFLELTRKLGIPPLGPTVNFLTQLMEIIRLIPMKAYPAEANRRRLLDAVQHAIDAVIAVEGMHA